jgi:hypothetical protein
MARRFAQVYRAVIQSAERIPAAANLE